MRLPVLVVAGLLWGASAAAQTPTQTPANPMSMAVQRGFVAVSDFIVRSAEQFPEDRYGFKATPEVRSFADEIGHVVDAHYVFCSRARNEASPQTARLEGTGLAKADLVARLKESVAYCTAAYEVMTDALLGEAFQVGQARGVRLAPLVSNTAHDNEHYGKIVTYFRLNGMTPPSSQPRQ